MFSNKKWYVLMAVLVIGSSMLASCAQPTAPPPAEPEVVEVEVTREVEVAGEVQTETVIVTATPEPVMPVEFKAPDPDTFTWVTHGDAETLDPAWNYESFGDGLLEDIYDQLVEYNGPDATQFVPELATSWEIVDEGKTYVFHIREGVKFHEGQDLSAEDVAYTFQRGLLQGGTWSPQWLYTEAFFGTGIYDVAELVDETGALDDDPEGLQAADPELLMATCERVVDAIVADEAAGTVTFYLDQAWGPLLATIAGSWGSILDKDWAIANGAWDGDCATWQNYYGITSENTPLRDIANGTGPYMFDHWTPGEEFVMVANPNYWAAEEVWPGGPSGAPRIGRVVVLEVDEWGTRFAMTQAGDADMVTVPRENVSQVDPMVGEWCDYVDVGEWDCHPTENPDGPLRLYYGYPLTSRTDALFNFDINVEGGNPYVGSGELDGNGIPPDFFSDEHVRKAFNYCFDWDAYIEDALVGEAVQNYGPINAGLIGYDPDAPHYSFDPDKCAAELELAWDGAVAENGFRMQIAYNTGNVTRQTISQILQGGLSDIDPKYTIEIIGLPWPSFLAAYRGRRLPIAVSGWGEDIHDPHNWAQPFLVGTYAYRQSLPDWMFDEFKVLVSAGVSGTTDEERAAVYREIQIKDYEYAPGIRLAVPTGRAYVQRWVTDWMRNPMMRQPFYAYDKE
jgi:peptide/nickel transport system substrate-binding protein